MAPYNWVWGCARSVGTDGQQHQRQQGHRGYSEGQRHRERSREMGTFGRAVVKREVGMIPSPARQQASGIWPTALPYGDARTRCSFSLCVCPSVSLSVLLLSVFAASEPVLSNLLVEGRSSIRMRRRATRVQRAETERGRERQRQRVEASHPHQCEQQAARRVQSRRCEGLASSPQRCCR